MELILERIDLGHVAHASRKIRDCSRSNRMPLTDQKTKITFYVWVRSDIVLQVAYKENKSFRRNKIRFVAASDQIECLKQIENEDISLDVRSYF